VDPIDFSLNGQKLVFCIPQKKKKFEVKRVEEDITSNCYILCDIVLELSNEPEERF